MKTEDAQYDAEAVLAFAAHSLRDAGYYAVAAVARADADAAQEVGDQ